MSNLDITPPISQALDNYPYYAYILRVWKESKGYSVAVNTNRPNLLSYGLDYAALIKDLGQKGLLFEPLSYVIYNLDKNWVGVLNQKEGIIPALSSNPESGTIFQFIRKDT